MTTLTDSPLTGKRIYPVYATTTRLPQVVRGRLQDGRAILYDAPEFRYARQGEIIDWHNRPYVVGHDSAPVFRSLVAVRDVSREVAAAWRAL